MPYALRFGGDNDIVTIPNGMTGNVGTSAYTMRVKSGPAGITLPASGSAGIIGTSSDSAANGLLVTNTGQLRIFSVGSNRYGSTAQLIFTGVPFDYTLTHLASGEWDIYNNLTNAPTGESGSFTTSRVFSGLNQFGRASSSAASYLQGDIAEITVTGLGNAQSWQADLSNGAGSTLSTVSGTNNGTLVNFTVPDCWIFYPAAGGTTYTGGGVCSFVLDATGGGLSSRIGGGTSNMVLDATGGGAISRNGGGVFNLAVGTAGSGNANRIGGGSFTFTLDTVGGGNASRIGGGPANILFGMAGGGEVVPATEEITGGAVLPIIFGMTGGGVVIRNAGALLSFSVSTTGGGTASRIGGGSATIDIDTTGSGVITVHGGAEITVHVDMTGGGNIQTPGYKPTVTAPVVAVNRTVRVPYSLIVQKSFRGAVCKL